MGRSSCRPRCRSPRRCPERSGHSVRRRAARGTRAGRRRTATTGRVTSAATSRILRFAATPSRTRPSSSENGVTWALETTPETLALTVEAPGLDARHDRRPDGARALPAARHAGRSGPADPARPRCGRVRRGDRRRAGGTRRRRPLSPRPPPRALQRADCTTSPRGRTGARAHAAPWRRAVRRPKRALYVSSPIGLGHAWRDVAIARELRALHPDLQIDWLAQDPVTRVLRRAAASTSTRRGRWLANESRHIAAESREHELNVFQAWRRMDEILLANFMVFRDVVREGALRPLDRRRGLGARLLPAREPRAQDGPVLLPDRLRGLAADARGRRRRGAAHGRLQRRDDRADRPLPQRARPGDLRRRGRGRRSPRLRRRPAGDPPVGPGPLRVQRLRPRTGCRRADATARRSVPSSDTAPTSWSALSRSAARASAPACCGRVIDAYPQARARLPGAAHDRRLRPAHRPRLAAVADDGLEVVTYVDRLSRHLAACDVALTQGGLTTCMELAAAKRAVRLLPAAQALRAEPARAPPPGALRGRPRHGAWPARHRRRSPTRSRRRSRAAPPGAGTSSATARRGPRD